MSTPKSSTEGLGKQRHPTFVPILQMFNIVANEMKAETESNGGFCFAPQTMGHAWLRAVEDHRQAQLQKKRAQAQNCDPESDSECDSDASFKTANEEEAPKLTSVSEVILLLTQHGCKDLTPQIGQHDNGIVEAGGYGDIYKATLLGGDVVAVKTPIILAGLGKSEMYDILQSAARELHTWQKCSHPNVLKLLGIANFYGRIGMISPWAANGSLQAYIRRTPLVNRVDLVTQVCVGLAYLHGQATVHGDLKAGNIVVDECGVPMIADFGHAFLSNSSLPLTTTPHKGLGSIRWTAPEILQQRAKRDFPGDVYALGMTILEIMSGKIPYSDVTDAALFGIIVDQGKLPDRPKLHIPPSIHGNLLWTLLKTCWSRNVQQRPSAVEVKEVMTFLWAKGFEV